MADQGDTWQRQLFHRLREADDWLVLGELFDEFRLRIPPYLAMRHAYVRYTEDNMPPCDKAQWLYFLNLLRGKTHAVEWRDHVPYKDFVYSDQIRLKRLATCQCGGERIKHVYGSNATVCLKCHDIAKPPRKTKKVVVLKPRRRDQHTVEHDEPAQVVPLRPVINEPVEPVVSEPDELDIVASQPQPETVVRVHLNPTPSEREELLAKGGIPITPIDSQTWISEYKNKLIIGYKHQLFWSVRSLAKYLKALLPFSVNRIEDELRRCGYRPAVLLAKYNINDNLTSAVVSINNRTVGSYTELANELSLTRNGAEKNPSR